MTLEDTHGDVYVTTADASKADIYHTHDDCQGVTNAENIQCVAVGLLQQISNPRKCKRCAEWDDNGGRVERECCPECESMSLFLRKGGYCVPPDLTDGEYRCLKCDHTFDQPATREDRYRGNPRNSPLAEMLIDAEPDAEIRPKDGDTA